MTLDPLPLLSLASLASVGAVVLRRFAPAKPMPPTETDPCVRGSATVLRLVSVGGRLPRGTTRLQLAVRVELPGQDAYETVVEWEVEPFGLAQVREALSLPVRVDRGSPSRVHPAVGWASLSARAWLAAA